MSPKSGLGGNRNNLHRHQTVMYLGFLQTKSRASPCADHYRLAAMTVPKRQAVAHTSQVHNQYDSGRLIIGPRWSRCTCRWLLAPRSFADHFLTFSGGLDNAALLPLFSLQRSTGDTTSILCLLVSLVSSHGPCVSDEGLLPRTLSRVLASKPEVLQCILVSWANLGLVIEAETSGLFPLLEPFGSVRCDSSTDGWRPNLYPFSWSAEERWWLICID